MNISMKRTRNRKLTLIACASIALAAILHKANAQPDPEGRAPSASHAFTNK